MIQGLGMPDARHARGAAEVGISEDGETAAEHRANGDLRIPRVVPACGLSRSASYMSTKKLHLLASLLELAPNSMFARAPRPARHEQCLAVTGTFAPTSSRWHSRRIFCGSECVK